MARETKLIQDCLNEILGNIARLAAVSVVKGEHGDIGERIRQSATGGHARDVEQQIDICASLERGETRWKNTLYGQNPADSVARDALRTVSTLTNDLEPIAETEVISDVLRDPIDGVTRAVRRNLMLAASIGLFMALSGMVPSGIAALGMSLHGEGAAAKLWFLGAIAATVLYEWVSYTLYVTANKARFDGLLVAARAIHGQSVQRLKELRTVAPVMPEDLPKELDRWCDVVAVRLAAYDAHGKRAVWRWHFDLYAPPVFAIGALIALVLRAYFLWP